MLSFLDTPGRFTRREWLRLGGLSAFGLSASALAGGAPASFGKAKACIVLFLLGGPPQQETRDPKPDAPPEIHGDRGVIRTATPGLLIGETMERTATLTNKIAVLRAVQTNDNAHSASGYFMTKA